MTPDHPAPLGYATTSVDAAFAQSPLGHKLREVLTRGKGSNVAIADFLLRNPVRAAAWGIEELASQTRTSSATLSRFARTLGFEGFAALRNGIAETLQSAMPPVFQPVDKLRDALQRTAEAGRGSHPVITESLESSLANLQATAAGLNPACPGAVPSASIASCSMAAGRRVSSEASSTFLRSRTSRSASLPAVRKVYDRLAAAPTHSAAPTRAPGKTVAMRWRMSGSQPYINAYSATNTRYAIA